MRRSDEKGEGKFGTIVGLVVMAAVLLAGWNVVPVYFANYSFVDKMTELCRVQRYNNPDEEIMRKLQKEARDLKIEDYINTQTCKITTRDHDRRIVCEYSRTVDVVPGYKHTFHFKNEVAQPLL
jgi:hypothetical protein